MGGKVGKRTDIPFKKVEITPAVWVALAPDKLMLGGNFLPAEMHLTLSFGVRSGWFDLHMTKNCDGRGLHAPLIKVPRADVESLGDLTIRWVGRTVFGSMADADLRAMAARRAVLLLLPETDDEDPELGEAAKANFGHLVGRRGAGKYRIDLDDPKFKAAIDGLVEPGAPIQNWLHGRLFRPSVLRNLPGRAGVVYDQGRAAHCPAVPSACSSRCSRPETASPWRWSCYSWRQPSPSWCLWCRSCWCST